jgi:hypothetical protein
VAPNDAGDIVPPEKIMGGGEGEVKNARFRKTVSRVELFGSVLRGEGVSPHDLVCGSKHSLPAQEAFLVVRQKKVGNTRIAAIPARLIPAFVAPRCQGFSYVVGGDAIAAALSRQLVQRVEGIAAAGIPEQKCYKMTTSEGRDARVGVRYAAMAAEQLLC